MIAFDQTALLARWRSAGATDDELDVISDLLDLHEDPRALQDSLQGYGDGDLRDQLVQLRTSGFLADAEAPTTTTADPDPIGTDDEGKKVTHRAPKADSPPKG